MLLSAILPCFNESASIDRFEDELFPALESLKIPYEVVVVDDGSTDETQKALREISRRRSIRIVRHQTNRGLGAALRSGFQASSGDWLVTLDADLTFHPSQIKSLRDRQKETGADLVAGSPFLTHGGISGVPWSRRLPSLMINSFYRGLFGRSLTSFTPIFRLYRSSVLKSLELKSNGFEINAEIAARFLLAKHEVTETPAVLTTRTEGVSKLSRLRELGRHIGLISRLMAGST